MANKVFQKRIADGVEKLLTENSEAKKTFRKHIRSFNKQWQKCQKVKQREEKTGEPEPFEPDPSQWQGDKKDCYYTYLAVVYDSVKTVAPYYLCDNMDEQLFGWLQRQISSASFDNDKLTSAIRWVQHHFTSKNQNGKAERSKIMITARTSKENWEAIRSEYDISKNDFGKKINFVSDPFKRKIVFRDVEHAFVLASQGFSKPALILVGGVIEELLRLYLKHKNIKPKNRRFVDYIKACEDNGLLKRGVSRLSDSIRDFRNLVHLDNEKTKRYTVSKVTAKGAVSSIFTIANDFQ